MPFSTQPNQLKIADFCASMIYTYISRYDLRGDYGNLEMVRIFLSSTSFLLLVTILKVHFTFSVATIKGNFEILFLLFAIGNKKNIGNHEF